MNNHLVAAGLRAACAAAGLCAPLSILAAETAAGGDGNVQAPADGGPASWLLFVAVSAALGLVAYRRRP